MLLLQLRERGGGGREQEGRGRVEAEAAYEEEEQGARRRALPHGLVILIGSLGWSRFGSVSLLRVWVWCGVVQAPVGRLECCTRVRGQVVRQPWALACEMHSSRSDPTPEAAMHLDPSVDRSISRLNWAVVRSDARPLDRKSNAPQHMEQTATALGRSKSRRAAAAAKLNI